jgi:hypothetical protein
VVEWVSYLEYSVKMWETSMTVFYSYQANIVEQNWPYLNLALTSCPLSLDIYRLILNTCSR